MTKRLSYDEAREKYGVKIVDEAMAVGAEPTSRLIYPAFEPLHDGTNEWEGSPVPMGNGLTIQAFYYLPIDVDPDFTNWEDFAEFEISEAL